MVSPPPETPTEDSIDVMEAAGPLDVSAMQETVNLKNEHVLMNEKETRRKRAPPRMLAFLY